VKAGFCEKDVTPPVGVYLAGYPSRKTGSEGIDDPLFLRVVAMEDDAGERLVIVTADLLKFPKPMTWRLKAWAQKTHGLPSANLIINLSHSHSSPGLFYQECYPQWPLDIDYIRRFEQAIREAIAGALDDLKPARVTFGVHHEHFAVSRRLPDPEIGGKTRLGQNPEGYYDPEMPMLAFSREGSDQPTAILYSYACHATWKSGQNISADWPGEVSRGLKRELGDDVMTLFVQGAGGSVATRRDDRYGTPEAFARVAKGMADFARSDAMRPLELKLAAAETEFGIPYDQTKLLTADELLEFADPTDTDITGIVPYIGPANRSIVRLWAQHIYEWMRTGRLPTEFGMHLTRVRLADAVHIVALSGEVTTQVGRMIKDLFPDRDTLFFGYCSYTDAYIPVASMLEEHGHEALQSIYFHVRPAPFVPEIDEILKRQVLALEPPE